MSFATRLEEWRRTTSPVAPPAPSPNKFTGHYRAPAVRAARGRLVDAAEALIDARRAHLIAPDAAYVAACDAELVAAVQELKRAKVIA